MLLLLLCSSVSEQKREMVIHSRADLSQAVDQVQADLSSLNQHHENYRAAAEKLAVLYSNLSKKAEAVTQAARGVSSSQGGSGSTANLMNATQQMQETQMSFNLQYLQLQETMQQENRQYTAVSNILKTKHDTIKNSISNIR